MESIFALVIHHKGKWLFENGELIRGILPPNGDVNAAVEEMLKTRLKAKKYDVAVVASVPKISMNIHLFLVDISSFADTVPIFLQAHDKEELPRLSSPDAMLFERTQKFIADCRRATEALLGREVTVIMDRPVGTHHPKHPEIIYPINYGYIDAMLSADGEGIDVYLLGIHEPLESARAKIIAVIRREDDIEDKLAAAPIGMDFSEREIADAVHFQEQFYRSSVHKSL